MNYLCIFLTLTIVNARRGTRRRPVPSSPTGKLGISYEPGKMRFDDISGIYLARGLKARVLATTGQRVQYSNGTFSQEPFHVNPDAGGCFDATDGSGGWYYMSNAEDYGTYRKPGGGVGRLSFDRDGNLIDYKMVLTGTRMNCGAGFTPWDTYITCEEFKQGKDAGQCWEVHPEELWPSRPTKMGGAGAKFESAAFDDQYFPQKLSGYVTTDNYDGAVHKYTPSDTVLQAALRDNDYSKVLHSEGGILEYLVLDPTSQTFSWTPDRSVGEASATEHFPNTEGIDAHDGFLYIVSKKLKELFVLDLDAFTYTSSSTTSGAFDGQPDQIIRLIPENNSFDKENSRLQNEDGLLYFVEDGGDNAAGVFARSTSSDFSSSSISSSGSSDEEQEERYFTIAEGGPNNSNEATGLAFCDNGRRMMFAFQDEGILFEVSRDDGMPFYGSTVDIHYHEEVHWPDSIEEE